MSLQVTEKCDVDNIAGFHLYTVTINQTLTVGGRIQPALLMVSLWRPS